ncbi:hypothetical protein ANCDUO_14408, partial [Ancylostoma duodenale]
LPRGKVIGKRWRIVRKLGEGGFGAVYKVEEINTNEFVMCRVTQSTDRVCSSKRAFVPFSRQTQ